MTGTSDSVVVVGPDTSLQTAQHEVADAPSVRIDTVTETIVDADDADSPPTGEHTDDPEAAEAIPSEDDESGSDDLI